MIVSKPPASARRKLALAALLSILLLPAAFAPPATAVMVRPVLPPRPLTTRPLVQVHQLNLSRLQNHVLIQPAGSKLDGFLIRQPGFPEAKAPNIDAVLRTLSERQSVSPHEALKIVPEFADTAQHDLFSAQLKTRRPNYFLDVAPPQLTPDHSSLTRASYLFSPLSSVQASGKVYRTLDGRWAQELTFGSTLHLADNSYELPKTVRVLSTLRELVEDIRNYLVWAYGYLVQSVAGTGAARPTADSVVHLALQQLAADSSMSDSELRALVTVQFNGLDVVLHRQDATPAAPGSRATPELHAAR